MIPNMTKTIKRKSISFVYVAVTETAGFSTITTEVQHNIRGVLQIPSDQTLQALGLDFSVKYKQVHITVDSGIIPKMNDKFIHLSQTFKIIRIRDFSEYGYYEFIGECNGN